MFSPSSGLTVDKLGVVPSSPRPARSSAIADGINRNHIRAAVAEWRHEGREEFFRRYGASPAQRYVLVVGGEEFDAMAILRSAGAHAGLDTVPGFRGDRRSVAEPLRALGFEVDDLDPDAEGPLGPDPAAYLGRTPPEFTGPTDTWTMRAARREQRWLKSALGIGTATPTTCIHVGSAADKYPNACSSPPTPSLAADAATPNGPRSSTSPCPAVSSDAIPSSNTDT